MPSRSPAALAALGVLLVPLAARAEDCREGWFCDDRTSAPPPKPPAAAPAPLPPEPAAPTVPLPPPRPAPEALAAPPPEADPSEIGFDLHIDVGLFGAGADDRAGLGGLGFAFRIRPEPLYAVDLGLEFLGGTDYSGNDRAEQAFVTNAVVFVNPRDRVQGYVLGGFHIGGAQVRVAELGGVPVPVHDVGYAYLGAQGGLGVEWRFTRSAALHGDFQLFVRGRVDSNRYYEPEYVDPGSHQITNTSGGGLFRAGFVFYF